ncbi:MAG: response regulator [Synechococcales bacterium]|nr:response regulator [Synechococcales bacterium]
MTVKIPKILIVEDDRTNQYLIRELLEWKGYDVYTLSSGERFLEVVQSLKPDVILLDLKLPGSEHGGFTLLEQLNQTAISRPSVIIYSACSLPHDIATAKRLGAAHYLIKPVGIDEILRTIHMELLSWELEMTYGKMPVSHLV